MKLARWIFLVAGLYGLAVLAPGFFMEAAFGAASPPPVNHPEFYYGFYGSAFVWQLVFLAIAWDPGRFRLLMPIAVLEKIAFFAPAMALYANGRLAAGGPFYGAIIDGVLMVLFALAWLNMPKPAAAAAGP